ncbi:hypothetical protein [Sphingomonas sp. 66-10]|mgnify:CR=1 FL=1|jgi:hypothetical protein|uniref:hypothetical protein n=1 Tax=Sphingomonas sp. 66-10 TaxID=1895848 RepID=UPI000A477F8E|nr:hypothetical protein [Sphingomonas sp. 66-10]
MATVLERVRGLIERLSPEPICHDCIARKLDRSGRQHANRKSRELAGEPRFERRKDICLLCCGEKIVIRRTGS